MSFGASPFLWICTAGQLSLAGRALSNGIQSVTLSVSQTKTLRLHRSRRRAALRKLLSATAISSLGDGLLVVAFPLLAIRLTSNPLLIGGVLTALSLPWLLIALPAGTLTDRVNRRRLVVVVDLLRALVVGGVALGAATGGLRIGELYAAAFAVGAGETVVSAAARSIVPWATTGDAMVAAQGRMNAARTSAVQFAGPALGGVLFAAARALPFGGDALSYVASAGLLGSALGETEDPPDGHDPERGEPAADRRSSLRADLRTGVSWFARSRLMTTLAATIGAFAFCQNIVLAVLVIYGSRVLHLSAADYGVFLALAAIGDLVGSVLAARVHALLGPYATLIVAGAVAAGGYLLLSTTGSRAVAVVALALEAAATSIGQVAVTTARYRNIPREWFGTLNNLFRMLVYGLGAAGALVGGALAAASSTQHAFLVAGILQVGLLGLLAVPLRRLVTTEQPAPAAPPL